MYSKLEVFRIVYTKIECCVWWDYAKLYKPLKNACKTMVRLAAGNNCLRLYKDHSIIRDLRTCKLCGSDEIQGLCHIIMRCPALNIYRREWFDYMASLLHEEIKNSLDNLQQVLQCNIFLGMNYPFCYSDLTIIRYISLI